MHCTFVHLKKIDKLNNCNNNDNNWKANVTKPGQKNMLSRVVACFYENQQARF